MLSTVWITLNTMVTTGENNKTTNEEPETFMFGPTGVVRFKTIGEYTALINSNSNTVAMVTNSQENIMDILRKMRDTEGKLDAKQNKAPRSKTKASKAKTSSKVKSNTK